MKKDLIYTGLEVLFWVAIIITAFSIGDGPWADGLIYGSLGLLFLRMLYRWYRPNRMGKVYRIKKGKHRSGPFLFITMFRKNTFRVIFQLHKNLFLDQRVWSFADQRNKVYGLSGRLFPKKITHEDGTTEWIAGHHWTSIRIVQGSVYKKHDMDPSKFFLEIYAYYRGERYHQRVYTTRPVKKSTLPKVYTNIFELDARGVMEYSKGQAVLSSHTTLGHWNDSSDRVKLRDIMDDFEFFGYHLGPNHSHYPAVRDCSMEVQVTH